MKTIAAAVLAFLALSVGATEPSIFVSLKVEQDGAALGSPSVLLSSKQEARLAVGDRLQVELVAAHLGEGADLRMRVYASSGETLDLVGSPRVVAVYGQEAMVAWVGESGETYRVTVKPLRATANVHAQPPSSGR